MHGFVTKNRMRNWDAANGFFPVIRLAQLHHIAAHGGYARLVSLSLEDAEEFVDEADKAHDRWVGAEPLSTQYAAEQTFTTTRFNKELSRAYKHHYASGNPYLARLRVPPQQVRKAQTKDIVATGRILETRCTTSRPSSCAIPIWGRVVRGAEENTMATAPSGQ
jgi:hypothetical protein